jgi:glycosyltransferase involved in cell wall biosynthesis
MRRRRLLTLSHSYVVALNRRLARELHRAAGDRWEVVAAAPRFFHGDLRPIQLEEEPGRGYRLEGLTALGSRSLHLFVYGPSLAPLLREGWDVVHAWEEPYVACGLQVAALTPSSSRLVFSTFQNLPKSFPPPFRQFERYALRRAAGWIGWGHTVTAAQAGRPGYRERPHATLTPGVDVEAFRPDAAARAARRQQLGWEGDVPVVGYLGRFVEEKGLGLLQRALGRLEVPWRALFIGGGPLEGELRAFAARHPGRAAVVTGVPHDDVPSWLNAMDVLAAPSQSRAHWKEQFGRMLVEAAACGVPAVASDSGEIPHTVGEGGLVVGESDEAGLGAALARLLGDAAARRELGERARARAHAEFSWSVVAQRHLAFFETL